MDQAASVKEKQVRKAPALRNVTVPQGLWRGGRNGAADGTD